jgi:solute carrier family 10 (sodium/bile acid cotransporter), member 7
MIHALARHWFLIALVAGLVLAVIWPGHLGPATAWIDPRVVVVTALFLMAWTLPSRSLAAELSRPGAAMWAVLLSYGLLPTMAWFLGAWLPIPDLRVGTLICVCGPCTLASAVLWTRLAHGNEATALLITVISTSTSWLITTAWLTSTTGTAVALDPMALMLDLVLSLILPVGAGQLCRAVPALLAVATRRRTALGVVSQLLILAILLRAAAQAGAHLEAGTAALSPAALVSAAAFCMGLHLMTLAGGWWSAVWLGIDRPRRIAVAFGCSQKTLPVALLIFNEYFTDTFPLAIVPILFFHAGQLLWDTAIAKRLAGQKQEAAIGREPTAADASGSPSVPG